MVLNYTGHEPFLRQSIKGHQIHFFLLFVNIYIYQKQIQFKLEAKCTVELLESLCPKAFVIRIFFPRAIKAFKSSMNYCRSMYDL